MRIYIIGKDGITLCREPPAAMNEGEIVVASNEELHAARLSGKRLLALWNALPDVEKRTKVGDRDALVDQLWSAVEALPDPDQQSDTKRPSKQDAVIAMLQRPEGATVDEVASAMGVAPGQRAGNAAEHQVDPRLPIPAENPGFSTRSWFGKGFCSGWGDAARERDRLGLTGISAAALLTTSEFDAERALRLRVGFGSASVEAGDFGIAIEATSALALRPRPSSFASADRRSE
jgi:hypothetical protein